MNVALIGPVYPYRGGIAHFTTALTRALQARHNVTVYSYRRQYPTWLYPGESDRDPSMQPETVPARYLLDSLNPMSWFHTAGAVTAQKPDAVLLQWWTTFWGPADLVLGSIIQRAGFPLYYLVHNALPHERRRWDIPMTRLTLGTADGLLALSRREAHRLQAMFPHQRIAYCPHPVYTLFSEQRMSQAEARAQLGLPTEGHVILFFGLVRPYKGLMTLLESLIHLRQAGIEVHVVVAGEFWDTVTPYQQFIQAHALTEHVTLHTGYIPNEAVAAYFCAADAFAAPYTTATQSGALKTALGFGLPVAASTAVAESADAPNGYPLFTAPPESPEAFAQALRAALQARPMAIQSQATWERLVQAIEEICT
ncbi:glycosyltransferase [Candidatus Parcubacteria bacterium]|nr:MAG: glycosyltransferase [Candidatus Parcubacteria bacterium]